MRRFWANIMLAALLAAALVAMVPLEAAANRSLPQDLTEMSLEDLMALEVTSAGKRSQKLADVAAAVFVITAEDIRRSGATRPESAAKPPYDPPVGSSQAPANNDATPAVEGCQHLSN